MMKADYGIVTSINPGGCSGYVRMAGNVNPTPMPFLGKAGVGDKIPVAYIHNDRQQPIGIVPQNRIKHLKNKLTISVTWGQYMHDAWKQGRRLLTAPISCETVSVIPAITIPATYSSPTPAPNWNCLMLCNEDDKPSYGNHRENITGTLSGISNEVSRLFMPSTTGVACINQATQETIWTHAFDVAKFPGRPAFFHIVRNNGMAILPDRVAVLLEVRALNQQREFGWSGEWDCYLPAVYNYQSVTSFLYFIDHNGKYLGISDVIRYEAIVGEEWYGTNSGEMWSQTIHPYLSDSPPNYGYPYPPEGDWSQLPWDPYEIPARHWIVRKYDYIDNGDGTVTPVLTGWEEQWVSEEGMPLVYFYHVGSKTTRSQYSKPMAREEGGKYAIYIKRMGSEAINYTQGSDSCNYVYRIVDGVITHAKKLEGSMNYSETQDLQTIVAMSNHIMVPIESNGLYQTFASKQHQGFKVLKSDLSSILYEFNTGDSNLVLGTSFEHSGKEYLVVGINAYETLTLSQYLWYNCYGPTFFALRFHEMQGDSFVSTAELEVSKNDIPFPVTPIFVKLGRSSCSHVCDGSLYLSANVMGIIDVEGTLICQTYIITVKWPEKTVTSYLVAEDTWYTTGTEAVDEHDYTEHITDGQTIVTDGNRIYGNLGVYSRDMEWIRALSITNNALTIGKDAILAGRTVMT